MSFLSELKRRNVYRAAAAYIAFSWLVVQVAETVLPIFGFGDEVVRGVVVVLAIGLLPALIASWFLELTPEGLKREAEVDHGSPGSRRMTRQLDRLIIVLLAIGCAYLAVDKFVFDPARDRQIEQKALARAQAEPGTPEGPSIAVLAFEDLSPDRNMGYFSEGISEELLNMLADIPALRVAGRRSAFSFKDKDATIAEIGAALKVAHLLDGSVRLSGDRIRISAQLIEVRNDRLVWSETYDREADDLFAIQDDIAARVVENLRVSLLGQRDANRVTDPKAYALYLKARGLFNVWDMDLMPEIGELLEKALAIDPDYVPAIALLARQVNLDRGYGPYPERRARVRQLIDRALSLDPDYGYALAWRGWLAMMDDGDLETGARYTRRAHEVDPRNYETLLASVRSAVFFGRADLAIRLGEYLVDRDPLCLLCYSRLALAYAYTGAYADAERTLRAALALDADWAIAREQLGHVLLLEEQPAAALEQFERLPDDDYTQAGKALAFCDLGRRSEYQEIRQRLAREEEPRAWRVAVLFSWCGETDAAFEWIERRNADAVSGAREALVDPLFRDLHDDPRWRDLLAAYGMSPDQLADLNYDLRMPD